MKELRLLGISDIETANAYLPTYIADYNRRFAVEPKSDVDAHRCNIPSDGVLDLIFSLQARRKLTKHLELSYNNELFQIKLERPGYAMRQAHVTVCEARDGAIRLIYKWQLLDYERYKKNQRPTAIVDSKQINDVVDALAHEAKRKAVSHKPSATHPWRQYERIMATVAARAAKRVAVTHNATKAPV